jgi:hypothetical protein
MSESRGNWEPERSMLGWTRTPAERICRYCRRSLMHTEAEHDLVYPIDRAAEIARDQQELDRQAEADTKLLERFIADGMTEGEAVDELMGWIGRGEGLIEPTPRPS